MELYSFFSDILKYKPYKGDKMAKGKNTQKAVKTAPAKSIKEKRAEKKAKKDSK